VKFRRGHPQRGRRIEVGTKNLRFLTNISLYLGKDAKYSHSYYGTLIGNRMALYRTVSFLMTSLTGLKVISMTHFLIFGTSQYLIGTDEDRTLSTWEI